MWFGSLSYSKLKLKKPAKTAMSCPACHSKLHDLIRIQNNFEAGSWKWGFYDPNEWRLVNIEKKFLRQILSKMHISNILLKKIIQFNIS